MKKNPNAITMQEAEALARQRNGNTVAAAQTEVDTLREQLKAAESRLEQAKIDAGTLSDNETTETTGGEQKTPHNPPQGVFGDDDDPAKFSIDAIQTWAQAATDPEKIKEVMKKETGEHGKKRAGVQQLLIARQNAIKAAENK